MVVSGHFYIKSKCTMNRMARRLRRPSSGEPSHGISDGSDYPVGNIKSSVEGITEHVANGVIGDGIHGEVPPGQILVDSIEIGFIRSTTIGVLTLTAEGGDFIRVVINQYGQGSVFETGLHRMKQLGNLFRAALVATSQSWGSRPMMCVAYSSAYKPSLITCP